MSQSLPQDLVATALDLLSREPAERLSMRRVAQSLGVSHQAPYVHFGSKRRFLAAVAGAGLQQAADQARVALDAAPDDPPQRLHALADAYVAFVRTRPHVHDLAYGPLVAKTDHPTLQRAAIDYWNLLHDTVESCQPEGTNEADTLRRSTAAWATVYGIARLAAMNQIPNSVPGDMLSLVHEAIDTLHHGWESSQHPDRVRPHRESATGARWAEST